ncbi:MAG: DUF3365 domain-containing protein [bacterium]|nr:DUF3365 domain-containing protein [bacterium]
MKSIDYLFFFQYNGYMGIFSKNGKERRISLSVYINAAVGIVFIITAALIILFINSKMRAQAILEAEAKAKLILEKNMATHRYFTRNLKPSVFALTAAYRTKDYFDPNWMSSTFAVREIDKYSRSLDTADYYYKECAVNARNPKNEADSYEKAFLEELNKSPQAMHHTSIRELWGKPYFVVMRRGEVIEESCLRCHDTPERAPKDLVKRYGPKRSFSRQVGDVVSAISIRIPLEIPYSRADRFSRQLSLLMLVVLGILFVCQYLIHKWVVLDPLKHILHKTKQIADNEKYIGEEITSAPGKELYALTSAFNSMSQRLRRHIGGLDEEVNQRTMALSKTNALLKDEIGIRKQSENEKEALIGKLENALHEIKTLRGILPLCSYCKKIRKENGEWEPVDVYIYTHSEADVSHSICPDCMKANHPNVKTGKKTK